MTGISVAEIAEQVFDAVGDAFSGVIKPAVLTRPGAYGYHVRSGEYIGEDQTYPCRAFIGTGKDLADQFPGYTYGPSEVMIWVEGLSVVPHESDRITLEGQEERRISRVGDIVGAGQFFAVAAI